MLPEEILREAESFGYYFIFEATGVELRRDRVVPMPPLQYSKLVQGINVCADNGRVLTADFVSIWLTEQDLAVIMQYYTFKETLCTQVHVSRKTLLPKWFRDYVFECFTEKCRWKGKDKATYNIKKAVVNSLYGMCCQKPAKADIIENYETGEYKQAADLEAKYNEHTQKKSSILPYCWGVWCTAYAFRSLFELGECIIPEEKDGTGGIWLYSDTDSCYGVGWDLEKLTAFNESRKQRLIAAGYGPAVVDGKEYWLGVAELDKTCTEFITVGAKRYAYRDDEGLHITVAGVPKSGAECLQDDIHKFMPGFIFPGEKTGKLTHSYMNTEVHRTAAGDIAGSCVDLTPCDYLLDCTDWYDLDDLMLEEVAIRIYDE